MFDPDENSKIQGNTKLNKKTVETLLNELFTLNDYDKNEQKLLEYTDSIGVTINKFSTGARVHPFQQNL